MAAFDMGDPKAVVSPGGVGFDINCGVRLLRTNLSEKDVVPVKEQLAQSMFDHIPVGVGSKGVIPMGARYGWFSVYIWKWVIIMCMSSNNSLIDENQERENDPQLEFLGVIWSDG